MKPEKQQQLFLLVRELIETTKRNIVRNVNSTIVTTYFKIGRMIVEDEQSWAAYAEYGRFTLKNLSNYLTASVGRGYSVDNLENMLLFFITFRNYGTVSRNSVGTDLNSETLSRNLPPCLNLSWSHYFSLLKIKNANERKFYKLEATSGNSSARGLQRQINSSAQNAWS